MENFIFSERKGTGPPIFGRYREYFGKGPAGGGGGGGKKGFAPPGPKTKKDFTGQFFLKGGFFFLIKVFRFFFIFRGGNHFGKRTGF